MIQKREKRGKEHTVAFVSRMLPRIKQELEWLADWHGISMKAVQQQAIHQMALRDLPGLQDTGIAQLRQAQEKAVTEEQRQEQREEQFV